MNEKILRWKVELMPYSFDVQHRPGRLNAAADALSRNLCAASNSQHIYDLHESLCHPGITRFLHFIKTRNFPYSVEEVKRAISACQTCNKCKPNFHRSPPTPLIQAMKPFDRLNVDFKGPLSPSFAGNRYILIIVDEYSRFPFAFPCKDMTASTVVSCLTCLFSIFGLPKYVH